MSRIWLLLVISCSLSACKRQEPSSAQSVSPSPSTAQTDFEEPPKVEFSLKRVDQPGSAGMANYDCTYEAQGKTARFRLQFKQDDTSKQNLFAWAEGKFIAVDGSDNSILLERLKVALEAKTAPAKTERIKELPFDAVVLGSKRSRGPGDYADNPSGDWIATKLFFPKGGDDGEVYLNLNPVLGKGEFSIKDSDYGDYLLVQFAKVL